VFGAPLARRSEAKVVEEAPVPKAAGTVSIPDGAPGRLSLTDETARWEITSHPATTVGGKTFRARVQRVEEPAVTEERNWPAYERVGVRRA
jgi:hypothetical protein